MNADNKADKFEEEKEALQDKFDHLWVEMLRLYDLASGKAAQECVANGVQELSMILEKLQVAVKVIKQDKIDIFEGVGTNEKDGGRGRTNT